MITADEIQKRIEDHIPGAKASLRDLGGGDHWSATVVASAFEGRSLIEQHKMVYAALADKMETSGDGSIHALQLKTMTPAQAGRQLG